MGNNGNIFWSRKKLLSYGAFMNMAVGARAIGKSYQAKDWAINNYITKGKTTKWVMRYQSEIDKATNKADFFGDDLRGKYLEKGYQILVMGHEGCYIRKWDGDIKDKPPDAPQWERFIDFSTMSERAIKAAEDPECALIVFDEFIPLPGTPYIKDEVTRFMEYIYTVIRLRNARILMLSNNVTTVSPYFSFFKVKLPKKGCFYFDKGRSIAIENCKNEEFAAVAKETPFGRLVQGTEYAAYAIDNETMVDLKTFVAKRPPNARAMVKILTSNGTLFLYVSPPGNLCIARDGPDSLPSWAIDEYTHYEGSMYIGYAGSLAKNLIRRHYENATLFFDDEDAKAIFIASCQNLIK